MHACLLKDLPVYVYFLTISSDCPYLLQMLLKFNHACTLVDLRLIYKPHSLPFLMKQGVETL